jgi:coronin-1B/1C/6
VRRITYIYRRSFLTKLRRNPFNDRVIASGSDDGKVFIWQVPQGFTLYSDAEEPADVSPVGKLTGHSR